MLRESVRSFLKWKIGDGSRDDLWHDNCHPQRVLSHRFDTRAIFAVCSYPSARMSSVLVNGHWQWELLDLWIKGT